MRSRTLQGSRFATTMPTRSIRATRSFVVCASPVRDGWSLYLDRVELSLHPTLPSAFWSGRMILPSQLAHLQLGTRVLPLHVRGDLRLNDLRSAEHGGSSDGGHLHVRSSELEEDGSLGRSLTAELTLDEAQLGSGVPFLAHGEISGRGDDVQLLWRAWSGAQVPGLSEFENEAWSIYAQWKIEHGSVDLSRIYVSTDAGSVRGRYHYDGLEHGSFLIAPRNGRELNLQLRDGELMRAEPGARRAVERGVRLSRSRIDAR